MRSIGPDHDLITDVGGHRARLVLPPSVTHLIGVVPVIHEMTIAGRLDITVVLDVRAVPRKRRLVDEPFAHEEAVTLVQEFSFTCSIALRILPFATSRASVGSISTTCQRTVFGVHLPFV
jgi:hypothetical protein